MRDFLILFVHLIGIVVRLAKPGGLRSVVAESVLVPASAADLKSRTQTCAQAARCGSDHHRFVYPVHSPGTSCRFCDCVEAFHSAVFPQSAEERKYRMLFSPQRG